MIPKLYIISRILNKKCKLMIYYAWIESLLRYGIEVYGLVYDSVIDRLQKIQNRIINTLFQNHNLRTDDLYKELNILKVRRLCEHVTILNNYYNKDFKPVSIHKASLLRKSSYRFDVIYPKNNFGKRQRSYRIPTLFNSLPERLFNIEGKGKMKKIVKSYLQEK